MRTISLSASLLLAASVNGQWERGDTSTFAAQVRENKDLNEKGSGKEGAAVVPVVLDASGSKWEWTSEKERQKWWNQDDSSSSTVPEGNYYQSGWQQGNHQRQQTPRMFGFGGRGWSPFPVSPQTTTTTSSSNNNNKSPFHREVYGTKGDMVELQTDSKEGEGASWGQSQSYEKPFQGMQGFETHQDPFTQQYMFGYGGYAPFAYNYNYPAFSPYGYNAQGYFPHHGGPWGRASGMYGQGRQWGRGRGMHGGYGHPSVRVGRHHGPRGQHQKLNLDGLQLDINVKEVLGDVYINIAPGDSYATHNNKEQTDKTGVEKKNNSSKWTDLLDKWSNPNTYDWSAPELPEDSSAWEDSSSSSAAPKYGPHAHGGSSGKETQTTNAPGVPPTEPLPINNAPKTTESVPVSTTTRSASTTSTLARIFSSSQNNGADIETGFMGRKAYPSG